MTSADMSFHLPPPDLADSATESTYLGNESLLPNTTEDAFAANCYLDGKQCFAFLIREAVARRTDRFSSVAERDVCRPSAVFPSPFPSLTASLLAEGVRDSHRRLSIL